MPPRVFVSYASPDEPTARRVSTALQARHIETFFAPERMQQGDRWEERLSLAWNRVTLPP